MAGTERRHTAGLDVVAATEAILRTDDEGLAAILAHADCSAMAEMACSLLAITVSQIAAGPDAVLAKFRHHFSDEVR